MQHGKTAMKVVLRQTSRIRLPLLILPMPPMSFQMQKIYRLPMVTMAFLTEKLRNRLLDSAVWIPVIRPRKMIIP